MTLQVERRLHKPRLPAHVKAHIVLPLQTAIKCYISEISPAGARLHVDLGYAFPSVLAIQLADDETLFYCDLVWRIGQDAGVSISPDQRKFWWIRSQAFNRRSVAKAVPAQSRLEQAVSGWKARAQTAA
jgi:hypothetical protein